MTYSQTKIDGDFTTYSDSELVEAATLYAVRGDRENHQRVGAERVARAVAPTFADRATVTRAFANLRDAVEFANSDAGDGDGVIILESDYAVRSIDGRIVIGFLFVEDGTSFSFQGYAYLSGPDKILCIVESADEIGSDPSSERADQE